MFRKSILLPLILLNAMWGCTPPTPIKATWQYVLLEKDDGGNAKKVGDKHSLKSGGDEMFEIGGKVVDVLTVDSNKAKFRLSDKASGAKKEVELRAGGSEDLWIDSFGLRLKVEKIAPLTD